MSGPTGKAQSSRFDLPESGLNRLSAAKYRRLRLLAAELCLPQASRREGFAPPAPLGRAGVKRCAVPVPARAALNGISNGSAGVICFPGLSPALSFSELGAAWTSLPFRMSVCFQLVSSEAAVSWSVGPDSRCAACWPRRKPAPWVEAQTRESDASGSSAWPQTRVCRRLEPYAVTGSEKKEPECEHLILSALLQPEQATEKQEHQRLISDWR